MNSYWWFTTSSLWPTPYTHLFTQNCETKVCLNNNADTSIVSTKVARGKEGCLKRAAAAGSSNVHRAMLQAAEIRRAHSRGARAPVERTHLWMNLPPFLHSHFHKITGAPERLEQAAKHWIIYIMVGFTSLGGVPFTDRAIPFVSPYPFCSCPKYVKRTEGPPCLSFEVWNVRTGNPEWTLLLSLVWIKRHADSRCTENSNSINKHIYKWGRLYIINIRTNCIEASINSFRLKFT